MIRHCSTAQVRGCADLAGGLAAGVEPEAGGEELQLGAHGGALQDVLAHAHGAQVGGLALLQRRREARGEVEPGKETQAALVCSHEAEAPRPMFLW